ncbi:glycosyltransferase family 4 protein [Catenovulum maritimum]|uniref:glycosyltransferase family 4 protein n=1 Tax=Catenovulum maritimum TaxID=1513271 RepID=UPI00069E041B|nr:glycosyltransferase family 4 protein [Catenovulum maritimum]
MKILTISSLYPNNKDFKHGVFVETRLKHLRAEYPEIESTVIAPVPWFPFSAKCFGEYARFAGVKDVEEINGVTVYHPKYLVIPKLGMALTPIFMARAIEKCLQRIIKSGQRFDVIDGHYFYPDGVAIARVANKFKIPFTCTARGTDINLIPVIEKPKKMIQKVFKQAAHMMSVCKALKDEMVTLGADDSRVSVLRNGVDLDLFKPSNNQEQAEKRSKLVGDKKLIISVGWLIERKGHYLVIEAMKQLTDYHLFIAGDGPDKQKLSQLVKQLNLAENITFLGALPQAELSHYYQAADALVLASSREGWANVLLESMASGTPVVAADIWGTPEVVAAPEAGVLVKRTSDSIAAGIKQVLANKIDRTETRQYAEKFSWKETSDKQYDIFQQIIKQNK